MLRGSRSLEMRIRIEAIPNAPRVVTLEMRARCEAILRAPRVVYSGDALSL